MNTHVSPTSLRKSPGEAIPAQLAILRRTVGLDPDGRGNAFKNVFAAMVDSEDDLCCRELVAGGLMAERLMDHPSTVRIYQVTNEGRAAVQAAKPPTPKEKRDTKDYRLWVSLGRPIGSFKSWVSAGKP